MPHMFLPFNRSMPSCSLPDWPSNRFCITLIQSRHPAPTWAFAVQEAARISHDKANKMVQRNRTMHSRPLMTSGAAGIWASPYFTANWHHLRNLTLTHLMNTRDTHLGTCRDSSAPQGCTRVHCTVGSPRSTAWGDHAWRLPGACPAGLIRRASSCAGARARGRSRRGRRAPARPGQARGLIRRASSCAGARARGRSRRGR